MDAIKDALTQAGNLVQQAAHTVVEALRGDETENNVRQFCMCTIVNMLFFVSTRLKQILLTKISIVNKKNSNKNNKHHFKKVK